MPGIGRAARRGVEELVEAGRRLDVEHERQRGEGAAEVEHGDVASAPGRGERQGGGKRGGAAAAGAGEADGAASVRRRLLGEERVRRRRAHRRGGEGLDEIVADAGEEDLAAEAGGAVGAQGDDGRADLAHRRQLVDRARRVGRAVEVHEDQPRSRVAGPARPRRRRRRRCRSRPADSRGRTARRAARPPTPRRSRRRESAVPRRVRRRPRDRAASGRAAPAAGRAGVPPRGPASGQRVEKTCGLNQLSDPRADRGCDEGVRRRAPRPGRALPAERLA